MIFHVKRGTFTDTHADIILQIAEETRKAEDTYIHVTHEAPTKKMTRKQQGALHIWLAMVAEVFNNAGFVYATRVKFNGEHVDIDWSMDAVKADVYKPLLQAMSGKSSTMDQDTLEPSTVALELTRHFAQKHGVTLPAWPSKR